MHAQCVLRDTFRSQLSQANSFFFSVWHLARALHFLRAQAIWKANFGGRDEGLDGKQFGDGGDDGDASGFSGQSSGRSEARNCGQP
jgi:hypothetical protein